MLRIFDKPIRSLRHWRTSLFLSFRRRIIKVLLILSDRRHIEGFEVCVVPLGGPIEEVFNNVRDALQLIRKIDERRFARAQRDLTRIMVRPVSRAHYSIDFNMCVLDYVRVLQSPRNVPMAIIHEATHARIHHTGIRYEGEVLKNRIERVCVSAELDFLQRCCAAGYADQLVPGVMDELRSFIATGEIPARWLHERETMARERKSFYWGYESAKQKVSGVS